jgi:dipeptidyl aminopeptidase/acylaminoacyl peptidase
MPPSVVLVEGGESRVLASTEHDGCARLRDAAGEVRRLTWHAPDGLEIEGLCYTPSGDGPFPLILWVHGGPVGAAQDAWPSALLAMLVSRGYAIVSPNPRGSSGRGRAFAELIVGDMGGDDALDDLAGVDLLVAEAIADPDRIGIIGGSYGGFMACWLPSVDGRFKASVSISPVTDWVSQHFTSSLAAWDAEFVGAEPDDPSGAFGERSPVMRAAHVATPTLLTAGLKDRATPPGQAIEFWQALRLRGVESEVVLYPQEGHGVEAFPASIDLMARTVAWFERHMPPDVHGG